MFIGFWIDIYASKQAYEFSAEMHNLQYPNMRSWHVGLAEIEKLLISWENTRENMKY